MKKIIGVLTLLAAFGILAGCRAEPAQEMPSAQTNPTTQVAPSTQAVQTQGTLPAVSREQAIDLALGAAGLTREQVFDLEAEPDREKDGIYWEVEFETREYDYSYEIHAETGQIAKSHKEPNR